MSSDDDAWHLPQFMRDFHDQKDVFRAVSAYDDTLRTDAERTRHPAPNWMDAHVYTVDVFLRFMAEHGYTLQKCRRDVAFRDIGAAINELNERRRNSSAAILNSALSKQETIRMTRLPPEMHKLNAMIGNKQNELNKLYEERAKLREQIARAEGEMSGMRDAFSVVEKIADVPDVAKAA
jgi:predicted  nucleic acid-binding Zn-ribbon protein